MGESSGVFSLYEQASPTKDDVYVILKPTLDTKWYEYRIIENNVEGRFITVRNNNSNEIVFNRTGNYKLEIKLYNAKDVEQHFISGQYIVDKDEPTIKLDNEKPLVLPIGYTLDLFGDVTVEDNLDGDITGKLTTNISELDLTSTGMKNLIYSVTDSAGNTATKTLVIQVVPNNEKQVVYIQYGILAIMIAIIILLLVYIKGMRLEKRLRPFGIAPLKDTTPSLFDNLTMYYNTLLNRMNQYLDKSVFLQKYAAKYDKYVDTVNSIYPTGMHYVSSKLMIGIFFLLIAFFSKAIEQDLLSIHEIFIPFLVGFFIPDIIYLSKYNLYRNRIENDLLQAITIMNNAFKSGRSITQAVELVTLELEGPIAEEFKKMHLEISFGLELDVVFKRFSDRINLEEVRYLTASLSILNKTGGNIIKVFGSIEKTLFNRKKLKIELSSLTGVSRLIVYALVAMPILFVVLIGVLNPEYFKPFYTTQIGAIFVVIMLLIYSGYVVVVRRMLQVRM